MSRIVETRRAKLVEVPEPRCMCRPRGYRDGPDPDCPKHGIQWSPDMPPDPKYDPKRVKET